MPTLDELIAQRDALKAAMRSGQRRVRLGSVETEFVSPAEMRGVLNDLEAEIATASGTPNRVTRQIRFTTDKGL